MRNLLQIILLILSGLFAQNVLAQDMLNINDFNFGPEFYNSSYIAEDSSSLNISTVVSTTDAVAKNSKFHFLLYGSVGKSGLGIGTKINTTFYNIFQSTTAEILLAKKVNIGINNSLNFAINTGLIMNTINRNRINQYTDISDQVIQNETYQKIGYTAGFGLNYNWKNKLDLGISLPTFVQTANDVAPVFFTSLAYNQDIGNDLILRPQILFYGPDYIKPTVEGSLRLDYKESFWLKVGARSTTKIIFGLGASINYVKLGYMYNLSFGEELKDVYPGLHSLNVSFHFLAKSPFEKKGQNVPDISVEPVIVE